MVNERVIAALRVFMTSSVLKGLYRHEFVVHATLEV